MAYAADGAKGVGAGAQVSYLAQELHGVPFLLQGIAVVVGFAVYDDIHSLDLHSLSGALRLDQMAFHADACTRGDALQGLLELCGVCNHLDIVYRRTVVQGNESHILVTALGAHPALHNDVGANQLLHIVGEQVFNFNSFHFSIFCFFQFSFFQFYAAGHQLHVGYVLDNAVLVVAAAYEDGVLVGGHDIAVKPLQHHCPVGRHMHYGVLHIVE